MASFAHPWLLLLLPAAGLLWLRPRSRAVSYSSLSLMEGLAPDRVPRLRFALQFLAVSCLALASAGPRVRDERTRLPANAITVVLVLDVSGSMEEESFTWLEGEKPISRAEAAKRSLRLFVAGGTGPAGENFAGRSTKDGTDAIGLVTFAISPQPVSPPTLHHAALLKLLDDVKPRGVLDAGTNIGDALAQGLVLLERAPTERKVLILLSDGEHNYEKDDPERKPLKPLQAAQLAANLGIPIYTIDTGGDPTGSPEQKAQRQKGREVNEAVARRTGGRAFTANDGRELAKVYTELDRLERQPVASFGYRRYFELTPWLLGIGLAAAVALFVLDRTFWRVLS